MRSQTSYESFIDGISFRLLQPEASRGPDRRFLIPRPAGEPARLLELPYAPIDVFNTRLPAGHGHLKSDLAAVCETPRMSTFAVSALINRAVADMSPDTAFVNVGIWVGFSLFSGMVGNDGKQCVGIDNFSEFGGPREAFMERFERFRGPAHEFHEMDYRDYFANVHGERPIGVYFYDGDHAYEHQLEGLRAAEPHFTDDCVVFVDDTNWAPAHQATYDFMASSEREYRVLLDRRTATNVHPTFWNGVIVFQATGAREGAGSGVSAADEAAAAQIPRLPEYGPIALEPHPPLVSLVLHNEQPDGERLEAAIDAAVHQTWSALEVIVADELGVADAQLVRSYGDRVTYIDAEEAPGSVLEEAPGSALEQAPGSALEQAVAASRGELIAFADVEAPLRPSAVQVGLAFPRYAQFNGAQALISYERLEQSLALANDLAAVVPEGASYALVNEKLVLPHTTTSRTLVRAFADGDASSPPQDDGAAVAEIERLRATGVDFVAFTWPTFDWLQRYPLLHEHLLAGGRPALENERLQVFDLR